MDEIAKRFFHDPAAYARAVELLSRYEDVENLHYEAVVAYLDDLDVNENELLGKAISHRKAVQNSQRQTLDGIALLERTIEPLIKSPPSANQTRSIQNKIDVGEVAGGIVPSSSEPS